MKPGLPFEIPLPHYSIGLYATAMRVLNSLNFDAYLHALIIQSSLAVLAIAI